MAQINFGARSLTCKLVYYGPGLSGKTTNLQYVYERLPPERRGELTSIATAGDRTIFFDFLPIEVGEVEGFSVTLQLLTVPGQSYYASTRKLVLTGADGVVFVADSQLERLQENMRALEELGDQLREQGKSLQDIPLVFQWNKRDLPNCLAAAEMNRLLNHRAAPAFEAVASRGKGVLSTLREVSRQVLQRCQEEFAQPAQRSPSGRVPRPPPRDELTTSAGDSESLSGEVEPGWDEAIGQTVGGCVIMTKLGEGGMGSVYLARHKRLHKTVVVKTLKPGRDPSEKRVKRFFREARAAARLDHENVVQVEEVGTDEHGMHYMIMQHVGGTNLREHVEERGPLMPFEAARIVLDVARALEATHRAGVIHRDVKPENVVISKTGEVKLIDFGLAKDLNMQKARSGEFVGTLLYMAPEMLKKLKSDARVDIYSLGLTFYFLISGTIPFLGKMKGDLIEGKARLKPPETFCPDLMPRFRGVLEQMLERDPDDRYPHITALIKDLEALWGMRGPSAKPRPRFWLWSHEEGSGSGEEPLTVTRTAEGRATRPRRQPFRIPAEPEEKQQGQARYRGEVLKALDEWDDLEEGDSSDNEIAALIERAWEPGTWGGPVREGKRDPASGTKSTRTWFWDTEKPLMGATWRLDLTDALKEIDAAPVAQHQRSRLSRDPGQAEVNALLRRQASGSAPTPSGNQAQAWTKQGIAKARAGDLRGAIADYTRALEDDPNYLPALANRGSAFFHMRRYHQAIHDCGAALEQSPRLAKAWLFRGISRAMLGSEGAREDMMRFLRLSPYSPYVNYIKTLLKRSTTS